jgi:hypothetical protein
MSLASLFAEAWGYASNTRRLQDVQHNPLAAVHHSGMHTGHTPQLPLPLLLLLLLLLQILCLACPHMCCFTARWPCLINSTDKPSGK